jgi:FkbM family methyltransferase
VYGEGELTKEWLWEHKEDVERIYGWLEDDLSKDLYLRVLAYHITGEISYLECEGDTLLPPHGYFDHALYHLDVGAYDGDTALEYLAGNPECKKIIAFEPNPKTYAKLVRNTDPTRVECILAACGREDGTATQTGSGRGSRLTEGEGDVVIRSLDSVCGYPFIGSDGLPVGSVKIDAEGEDVPVLQGAGNLITACKPALCVSAYHRAYDLLEIPLHIKRLNYKGRLYFRKKPYVPAWDTVFYSI